MTNTNYALQQGYTILDLSNFKCQKCFSKVYNEKNLIINDNVYPFYCAECDENLFEFEVMKDE